MIPPVVFQKWMNTLVYGVMPVKGPDIIKSLDRTSTFDAFHTSIDANNVVSLGETCDIEVL